MAEPRNAARLPGARESIGAHGLQPLTTPEFRAFRGLIYDKSGITLSDSKTQLVASRLARRLRAHGLDSYGSYFDLVMRNDPDGTELRELLNAITTNKTDFFRERHHFDFVTRTFLPRFLDRARRTGERNLRVWSAGCSSGEEPYTIAMTLLSALPQGGQFPIQITATDLDTQVLDRAQSGVYSDDVVAPVPIEMQRRFFRRGTGANAGKVRVNDSLRELITFRQLNFVEQPWPVQGPFDLIFCRNVMIYFNAATQHTIVEQFAQRLRPDGYLFIGHSETLNGLSELYEPLRGTIYRRRAPNEARDGSPAPAAPALPPPAGGPTPARPGLAGPAVPQARIPRMRATQVAALTGQRVVSVIIGGVSASREPAQLRTLLGSCVCACLYDPGSRIGGINHFMLPDGMEDTFTPTRYGVNAMEMLINELLKLGADRRRLQAKAFGAAHVLSGAGLSPDVPRKNAKFVKEFLQTEGIPLVSSRLGGSAPVEVMFATDTGKALVRALGDSFAQDLMLEESRFDLEIRKKLSRTPDGSVELF